jgi:hypothetical protein
MCAECEKLLHVQDRISKEEKRRFRWLNIRSGLPELDKTTHTFSKWRQFNVKAAGNLPAAFVVVLL